MNEKTVILKWRGFMLRVSPPGLEKEKNYQFGELFFKKEKLSAELAELARSTEKHRQQREREMVTKGAKEGKQS